MSAITKHVVTDDAWSQITVSTLLVTLQAASAYPVEVFIGQSAPGAGAVGLRLDTGHPPVSFTLDDGDVVYARLATSADASGALLKWE